jgi:hypothetical protein
MIMFDLKSIISELISNLIFYLIILIIKKRSKKRKIYRNLLDKKVGSGCDLIRGRIHF